MYLIAKLLMNSLYGRFGLTEKMNTHIVVANAELTNTIDQISIKNASIAEIIDLNNGKTLLTIEYIDDVQSTLVIGILVYLLPLLLLLMQEFL